MSGSHPVGFCPSPFSSLLLALSTPGQGAAGAGWSWGPQGFSRRIMGIPKGAWTCSRRQPGGSGRTWGGSESHWVLKHCVPSGDRVSLGHSHLCSSEPSDEGRQLLSPHPDLDHGTTSSHLPIPRISAIWPHPPHPLGHLEPLPELSFRPFLERGKAPGLWWLFWPCLHGARERQAAGQGWSWALASRPHSLSACSVARSSR